MGKVYYYYYCALYCIVYTAYNVYCGILWQSKPTIVSIPDPHPPHTLFGWQAGFRHQFRPFRNFCQTDLAVHGTVSRDFKLSKFISLYLSEGVVLSTGRYFAIGWKGLYQEILFGHKLNCIETRTQLASNFSNFGKNLLVISFDYITISEYLLEPPPTGLQTSLKSWPPIRSSLGHCWMLQHNEEGTALC